MGRVRGQAYVDARLADHARLHDADARALQAVVVAQAGPIETIGSLVTRSEMNARFDGQQDKIDSLQAQAVRSAIAAGVVSAVIGLLAGGILVKLLAGG